MVSPLSSRARLERMSEPWSLSRIFAMIVTFALAMVLGAWAASGEFDYIILVAVWFTATMIIIFVQDHWWSPALVISSLGFTTTAMGFRCTGLEIGVFILALTFPVKLAMKTLRKAEPEMDAGIIYWALLGYVAIHTIVILCYNKIELTPSLKNIVKAYYECLTPLVFYGLLVRYCHPRTVKPTVVVLFFTTLFTVTLSTISLLKGFSGMAFSELRISVDWLDATGATALLRSTAPTLYIGSLAFWPTLRSDVSRLLVGVGMVVGTIAILVSGGRVPLGIWVAAGIFFAVVRGKLWLAIPIVVATLLTSAVITAKPALLYDLPVSVQRTLGPLNFSGQQTEIQQGLQTSDDWHRNLRERSLTYWTEDTGSFWLGHGYKSWDPTIDLNGNLSAVGYDHLVQIAVEMGLTENSFSAITNIFGLTGLILYAAFMVSVGVSTFKALGKCPPRSAARALCEFSLVTLVTTLLLFPLAGAVPGMNVVYWGLGLLAARPYLGAGAKAPARKPQVTPLPAFIHSSLRPSA